MTTVTVQRPAWNHLAHGGGELAGSRRIAGGDIGGKLRFKYFRRPMVLTIAAILAIVFLSSCRSPQQPPYPRRRWHQQPAG